MVLQRNPPEQATVEVGLVNYDEEYEKILPEAPRLFLKDLRKTIGKRFGNSGTAEQGSLKEMSSCLDRLETFLFQVNRVAQYADPSRWQIPPGLQRNPNSSQIKELRDLPSNSGLAISGKEVCSDFESLLFHARAALDRLTLFLNREYRAKSDRFSRLKNVLNTNKQKDNRASRTLSLLEEGKAIVGILTDLEGDRLGDYRSLRSKVAHRSSISEGSKVVFFAWRLEDRRFLFYDCESLGYPVIATSRILALEVPFIAINTIGIYLGGQNTLSHTTFDPPWTTPCVALSQYIISNEECPDCPLVGAPRFIINGVRLEWQHVKPELLQAAVSWPNP
jgi:hypothetical protein